jgi:hypothetical protein
MFPHRPHCPSSLPSFVLSSHHTDPALAPSMRYLSEATEHIFISQIEKAESEHWPACWWQVAGCMQEWLYVCYSWFIEMPTVIATPRPLYWDLCYHLPLFRHLDISMSLLPLNVSVTSLCHVTENAFSFHGYVAIRRKAPLHL